VVRRVLYMVMLSAVRHNPCFMLTTTSACSVVVLNLKRL
jgi:hypothetical protein